MCAFDVFCECSVHCWLNYKRIRCVMILQIQDSVKKLSFSCYGFALKSSHLNFWRSTDHYFYAPTTVIYIVSLKKMGVPDNSSLTLSCCLLHPQREKKKETLKTPQTNFKRIKIVTPLQPVHWGICCSTQRGWSDGCILCLTMSLTFAMCLSLCRTDCCSLRTWFCRYEIWL